MECVHFFQVFRRSSKKTALHAVHPIMMYVYVQEFISSLGIYFPLYGDHEFLAISLERELERGATVDVRFLFISSRYVTYVSCVRIVKNKVVYFTCVNVVYVMNISIYICRNYTTNACPIAGRRFEAAAIRS